MMKCIVGVMVHTTTLHHTYLYFQGHLNLVLLHIKYWGKSAQTCNCTTNNEFFPHELKSRLQPNIDSMKKLVN